MSEQAPRITRRTMLGGAAAAGAGVLLGPVAGAAARMPRPSADDEFASGRVFGRSVGRVGGSALVIAPRRFALAGVQWSGDEHARIELRARCRDGAWGPWALASVTGHDADSSAGEPGASFGEPLWVGAADEVQLRSSRAVDDVIVHFVARAEVAAAVATAAALPLAGPVLDAGPGQPPIIARSVWAQGHAPTAGPASYGTIRLAFVHHTVNPNGYSRGEVPALLHAIFDYHRYVRGFFDIAYNFMIDLYGRIWEARAGGIDEPVVGAHAGAYNQESTGVAVLGTFTSVVPSSAAIEALERLLAWKLALHGIPSLGKVTVLVDPADAFYTPFRPGAHVRLPRVAGHRDGDLTDCPGTAFYDRLPSIRPKIAALEGVPAVLTLAAPTELVAPADLLALSGLLKLRNGPPLPGAPIEIQTLANDRSKTVASAITAADGSWSATVPQVHNLVVRALHPVTPAAASNVAYVGLKPVVTLSLASPTPPRVSGTIMPPRPRVTLTLYRLVNGHRRLVRSRTIAAVAGQFSARVLNGAKPGNYVIVASTPESAGTLAAASPPVRVTV